MKVLVFHFIIWIIWTLRMKPKRNDVIWQRDYLVYIISFYVISYYDLSSVFVHICTWWIIILNHGRKLSRIPCMHVYRLCIISGNLELPCLGSSWRLRSRKKVAKAAVIHMSKQHSRNLRMAVFNESSSTDNGAWKYVRPSCEVWVRNWQAPSQSCMSACL